MNTKRSVAAIAAGILISTAVLSQANPILLDRTPRSFDAEGNAVVPAAPAFTISDSLVTRSDIDSKAIFASSHIVNGTFAKDDSQRSFLSEGAAAVGSRAAAFQGRQKLGGRINYSGPQPAGLGVTDSISTGGLLSLACLGLVFLSRRLRW